MNPPFKPKGRTIFVVKVPLESDGGIAWQNETTGTRDRLTARAMARMVETLGPLGKGAFDLLRTVTDRPRRWELAELHRHWLAVPGRVHADGTPIEPSDDERIKSLRAMLSAANVVPLVADWYKVLTGPAGGIAPDTAKHYRSAVREFVLSRAYADDPAVESWEDVPEDAILLASDLTERNLRVWIEEMDDVEPGTVRKKGSGMRRFLEWLKGRGVLAFDPMREVALPAAGAPRVHYVDTPLAKRLAEAQPGQYRNYSALLAGTGIEVSVALRLRPRDVERRTREIRAAGTKTHNRDRIVRVAEWAWLFVEELLKGRHPDALLFDEIPDRWHAADEHKSAVQALAPPFPILLEHGGYTMRDARHTWAVRAARSGWPIEGVARQLGHKDGVLALRVYGRFVPTSEEREKWEQMATARDQAIAEAEEREQRLEEAGE